MTKKKIPSRSNKLAPAEGVIAHTPVQKKQKVPLVVSKQDFEYASDDSLREMDHPQCILPEHYFDALVHRQSSSSCGHDIGELLSIESWREKK
ncbi:hypothetical protein EBR25_03550 [bacterium]|nr:hypothetical protein [bacterium]